MLRSTIAIYHNDNEDSIQIIQWLFIYSNKPVQEELCKGLKKHTKKPQKYIMAPSSQVADYVIGKARHLYLK